MKSARRKPSKRIKERLDKRGNVYHILSLLLTQWHYIFIQSIYLCYLDSLMAGKLTFVPSLHTVIPLLVPSPAVLKYMEKVLSANSTDGSQLLPIQSDVASQGYTVRANLEPRSTQVE